MRYVTYIFALLLCVPLAFASDSDNEEGEPPLIELPKFCHQEDDGSDLLEGHEETIQTIDDLENLLMAKYQDQPSVMPLVADIYGLPRLPDVKNGSSNLPLELRFFRAISRGLELIKAPPCLNYNDLLNILQTGTFKTPANVAMAFCSLRETGDECYALTNRQLLANLSPDMTAYCTIYPYTFLSVFKNYIFDEQPQQEMKVALLSDIRSEFTKGAISSIKDIHMQSGTHSSLPEGVEVQPLGGYKTVACCPIYRLYKGKESMGVFALVSLKVVAADRTKVLPELQKELMAGLANHLRQNQEKNYPDYSKFKKK
jgi:hypothetical protein